MGNDNSKNFISQVVQQTAPGLSRKISTKHCDKSVMTLLKEGTQGLMQANPKLSYLEAKMLHQRFEVVAYALARQHREQRQQGVARSPREEKGLGALTVPLTYESEFHPNWSENTLPDALDSSQGAVAYLYDLLSFLDEKIEKKADTSKAIPLSVRRPDIYEMTLDEENVQGIVSKIKIINQILEVAILKNKNETDLDKLLLNVRFPYRFPFENYLNQIHAVLDEYDLSMGDIKRACSMQAPYFTQSSLHTKGSDAAIWLDSRLGPQLRTILLASPTPFDSDKNSSASVDYFKQNFGVKYFSDLLNTTLFCQQLKLERKDLEALFSRGEKTSRISKNVILPTNINENEQLGDVVAPNIYGSVFINGDNDRPAISLENDYQGKYHRFNHLNEVRCERIERFLRLARALELPFEQLDMLLISIMTAEQRQSRQQEKEETSTSNNPQNNEKTSEKEWTITNNTLRAIGLFTQLNRKLKCTVEQFCVLLDGINIYSQGKDISYFDRLFNNDECFSYRFILDDKSMDERDINRVCSAFGINYDTFAYLALVVRQVFNLQTLTRSRKVISAIYRTVVLANLLKIKPLELLSLLKVMNPDEPFESLLMGEPENRMYLATKQADIVSIIHSLMTIQNWKEKNSLTAAQLFNWITPPIVEEQQEKTEQLLFKELASNTNNDLFNNELLWSLGIKSTVDWCEKLKLLVNEHGILIDTEHGFDWEGYKNWAEDIIDRVVKKELADQTIDKQQEASQSILATVLEKRTAQWKGVSGLLEGYLDSKADNITPALYWCGSSTEELLTLVRTSSAQDSKLMELMPRLRRYEQIISQFRIESAMMSQLLSYDHNVWYGLQDDKPSLLTLYRLSVYRDLVDESKQPAEKLSNYLELINTLPADDGKDAIRLYRDQSLNKLSLFMGWSVNELLTVAQFVAPQDAIIRTLPQLLIVKQIHQLCLRTGFSARSIISISELTDNSDSKSYQQVAEQLLESLSQQDVSLYSNDESSQGDLTASVSATSTLLVLKSSEEEEETTQLTVKLQTLDNQPLVGVSIRWEQTSQVGTLFEAQNMTDKNGLASVTLKAGNQQGLALVKAHYGVKSISLPTVRIDCDERSLATLSIITEPENVEAIPADGNTRVRLMCNFIDQYGNPGIDKLVHWETTGGRFVYIANQSMTDEQGDNITELVSDEIGEVTVTAYFEGNPNEEDHAFAVITFK